MFLSVCSLCVLLSFSALVFLHTRKRRSPPVSGQTSVDHENFSAKHLYMVGNENCLNGHTVRWYYSKQSYPFLIFPFWCFSTQCSKRSGGKLEVARFWSKFSAGVFGKVVRCFEIVRKVSNHSKYFQQFRTEVFFGPKSVESLDQANIHECFNLDVLKF